MAKLLLFCRKKRLLKVEAEAEGGKAIVEV